MLPKAVIEEIRPKQHVIYTIYHEGEIVYFSGIVNDTWGTGEPVGPRVIPTDNRAPIREHYLSSGFIFPVDRAFFRAEVDIELDREILLEKNFVPEWESEIDNVLEQLDDIRQHHYLPQRLIEDGILDLSDVLELSEQAQGTSHYTITFNRAEWGATGLLRVLLSDLNKGVFDGYNNGHLQLDKRCALDGYENGHVQLGGYILSFDELRSMDSQEEWLNKVLAQPFPEGEYFWFRVYNGQSPHGPWVSFYVSDNVKYCACYTLAIEREEARQYGEDKLRGVLTPFISEGIDKLVGNII